jgi:hypothetical protein
MDNVLKAATVGEIIDKLKEFNPDLPCYFRPKYSGTVESWEDCNINLHGITVLEPNPRGLRHYNVTFLC